MKKSILIIAVVCGVVNANSIHVGIGYGIGFSLLTAKRIEVVTGYHYSENMSTFYGIYSGEMHNKIQAVNEPFIFIDWDLWQGFYAGFGLSYSNLRLKYEGEKLTIINEFQSIHTPIWLGYNQKIHQIVTIYSQIGIKYGYCYSHVYEIDGEINNIPFSDVGTNIVAATGEAGLKIRIKRIELMNGIYGDYSLNRFIKKGVISQFDAHIVDVKFRISVSIPIPFHPVQAK
jgi:hypothetical protein